MKPHKIALLLDPDDLYPASNQAFLDYLNTFAQEHFDIQIDYLTKKDLPKLSTYDGLFIRTGTSILNYTYQWALFAEYFNVKTIDTSRGIALGSNKHLQYELCQKYHVPIPASQILYPFDNIHSVVEKFRASFPLIIKTPSGSFSNEVFKAETLADVIKISQHLFATGKFYSLILQEYMYTNFDWRVGILNKKPLFASKYYMVNNHWQIIKYENDQMIDEGNFETVSVANIPDQVLQCALGATEFLDDGLYGLDIKLIADRAYLIEINDNPNIYYGIEDVIDRENICTGILKSLSDQAIFNLPIQPKLVPAQAYPVF